MHERRLKLEPLEDRRMLATFTVSNLLDGSVTAAGHLPGSLRQAIFDANLVPGADEIVFESTTGTLLLTAGELKISETLSVIGPGQELLSIDASGNDPTPTINNGDGSRIFHIDDGSGISDHTVSMSGLTLRGGDVGRSFGLEHGGAILSYENLILSYMTITENNALGYSANPNFRGGGAIFLSSNTGISILSHLIIEENSSLRQGGGIDIYASDTAHVEINDSVIKSNHAGHGGGGVVLSTQTGSSTIEVNRSSVVENIADANGSGVGGGRIAIFSSAPSSIISIRDSAIVSNTTGGRGGGMNVSMGISTGSLFVSNTTFSGNHSTLSGGVNISSNSMGLVVFNHVAIVANTMLSNSPAAGLVLFVGTVTVKNSIIARNLYDLGNPSDIRTGDMDLGTPLGSNMYTFFHSLVGIRRGGVVGTTLIDQGGNLFGTVDGAIDPRLGELADNGGPTMTHSLLPDSPAFNAGDPTAIAGVNGVPEFDQRGSGFSRSFGGRIDMGAFESRSMYADFDVDGDVDGRDFLAWQRNTIVGSLTTWQNEYGAVEELSALRAGKSPTEIQSELTRNSTFLLPTVSRGETASDVAAFIDESQPLAVDVDEAFAQLGLAPRNYVRDTADIAVSRTHRTDFNAVSFDFVEELLAP